MATEEEGRCHWNRQRWYSQYNEETSTPMFERIGISRRTGKRSLHWLKTKESKRQGCMQQECKRSLLNVARKQSSSKVMRIPPDTWVAVDLRLVAGE